MFQMLCSSSFAYSGFKWASDFAICVLSQVERGGKMQCSEHRRNFLIWGLKASFWGDRTPDGATYHKNSIREIWPSSFAASFCSVIPSNWFWNGLAVFTSAFFLDEFSIPITISSCKKNLLLCCYQGVMFSLHSPGSPSLCHRFFFICFKLAVWHSQ